MEAVFIICNCGGCNGEPHGYINFTDELNELRDNYPSALMVHFFLPQEFCPILIFVVKYRQVEV